MLSVVLFCDKKKPFLCILTAVPKYVWAILKTSTVYKNDFFGPVNERGDREFAKRTRGSVWTTARRSLVSAQITILC